MKAGQSASMVLLAGWVEQQMGWRGGDGLCISAGKGGDAVCKGGAGTPWSDGDRVQNPTPWNLASLIPLMMLQCCCKQKLSCLYILLLSMFISSISQLGFYEKTLFDWELWLFNTLVLTTPSSELHLFSLCGPTHLQFSLTQSYLLFCTTHSQITEKYKCAKQISSIHTGFLHSIIT